MPFTLNPSLIENDDIEIVTDTNGDLAIRHKPTGNTITVDENITLSEKADLDGTGTASLQNYAAIDTDQAAIRELDGVYRVDPNTSDIGSEIMDIHDNQLPTNGGVIYIPPGRYDQNTPITLEKWCTITSSGGYMSYSVDIVKQGDFDALTLLIPPGENTNVGGYDISNLYFTGWMTSDSSRGVVIRSIAQTNIKASGHGSHGIHLTTPNDREDIDSTNYSQHSFVAGSNGGDGVRIDSPGDDILNLNAMDIFARVTSNGGVGFNNLDGYSNRFHVTSEGNDGKGINIADNWNRVLAYIEANGATSTAPGVRNEIWGSTDPNRWDKTSFGEGTTLKFGGRYDSNALPLKDIYCIYLEDDFQTTLNNFSDDGARFLVQDGSHAGPVTVSSTIQVESLMGQRYFGNCNIDGGTSTAVTIDRFAVDWIGLSPVTDSDSGADGIHIPSTSNNVLIERVDLRGADGTGVVVDGDECVINMCRGGSVQLNGVDNYVVACAGTTVSGDTTNNTIL